MTIITEIEQRRAKRALDQKPIDPELLERLAQAAHLAPSCANSQPWRIITVTESGPLAALKETLTTGNYWGLKAPAITAIVTSPNWDFKTEDGREFALFDTGMAAYAYQIQAVYEGLFVHPIAGFDALKAAAVLGIPEGAKVVTLIILGYPGSASELNEKHQELEISPRLRKPLNEVFAKDHWSATLIAPAKW